MNRSEGRRFTFTIDLQNGMIIKGRAIRRSTIPLLLFSSSLACHKPPTQLPFTMTTLLTIPSVTAYHIPGKNVQPLTLAVGDLTLLKLPAQPPVHPQPTITLSIGSAASFPLSPKTPVHKVDSNAQHASYVFEPLLPEATHENGEKSYGRIKIVLKESTSVAEHEAAEKQAAEFVDMLKSNNLWKDMSYYDEEDEAEDKDLASYGASLAKQLSSYGSYLAGRLGALTDSHVRDTPAGKSDPSQSTKDATSNVAASTATLASYTHSLTETISHAVQEGAKVVGGYVREAAHSVGADEGLKDDGSEVKRAVKETVASAKQAGSDAWEEVSLAAVGASDG